MASQPPPHRNAKTPSKRNKTLRVTGGDVEALRPSFLKGVSGTASALDSVICGDATDILARLTARSIDLAILDPPYNLNKAYKGTRFARSDLATYTQWMESWFGRLLPLLKSTATVYVCSDWSTSPAVYQVLSQHMTVRNRITWEREKGRGAAANWKNCSEDIWYATVSDVYHFDVGAVRLKRRVVAPYRQNGKAKGWIAERDGNFRLTAPSNLWTDITVPFWSMPENTEHPTQKPEKLIAKLILASSRPDDVVLDPFLGSGTTACVCKKLGRRFVGIEIEPHYCTLSLKRIEAASLNGRIQGYENGVFHERNTMQLQMQGMRYGLRSKPFLDAAE
jgi:site-specific DNA-methyltransferase (adenine-specific)